MRKATSARERQVGEFTTLYTYLPSGDTSPVQNKQVYFTEVREQPCGTLEAGAGTGRRDHGNIQLWGALFSLASVFRTIYIFLMNLLICKAECQRQRILLRPMREAP